MLLNYATDVIKLCPEFHILGQNIDVFLLYLFCIKFFEYMIPVNEEPL